MIDKNELLFVVDEYNSPVDALPRHIVHKKNLWHRTAHIWLTDGKNSLLCQKRSILKDSNPGKWEPFFGGHLGPKEEYKQGASDELYEELGLVVQPDTLEYVMTFKAEKSHEFQGVFVFLWKESLSSLILEKEEIDEVQWMSMENLRRIVFERKDLEWTWPGYIDQILTYLQKFD